MMGYQVASNSQQQKCYNTTDLKTSCWWHNMCISLLNCMQNIMSTDWSCLSDWLPRTVEGFSESYFAWLADHFRWVNWNSTTTSTRFFRLKKTNNQSKQERNLIITDSIWKEECRLTLSLKKKKKRVVTSIRLVKESLPLLEMFTALWNSLIPAFKYLSLPVTHRKEAQSPPLLTAVTQDVSCPDLWH